ncbi:LysR substrate-binding domain-containing protein [Nocardioides cavernaquae]|uniref:LysR family transcriptional regulator n=1 Tax=Nocardioides cavernaquae TaxID=2321396 RepID=A0A3A5HBD0_9ACTN|nr:LysR substrate-binding domain-containing protein [Nocardioides cavernaquae]RJS47188.1 LysR family transcriptional regulator [Nocardioides cavernaquae]
MTDPFRVAFVAGVSPDKWTRRWRDRFPDSPLEVTLVPDEEQRAVLTDGAVSMSFVRLPVAKDGLHVIPLYVEVSVAVVSVEDDLSLHDELTVAHLADRQLVTDPAALPAWSDIATVQRLPFPAMSAGDAVEVVASGTGVAVLPMSVARMHHRKDVVARVLTDGPEHPVGLAWRVDDVDPRIETFMGIVRGRTANSSRSSDEAPKQKPTKKAQAKRAVAKTGGSAGSAARKRGASGRTARKPKRR